MTFPVRIITALYGIAAAGVFLWLTTTVLVAFLGWWALSLPVAWAFTALHYRLRRAPATLEHRLFAVGLSRTNDV